MLHEPAFGGEGTVLLSTGNDTQQTCVVEFRAGDRSLTQLGVHAECHPQASIMISFDLADGEWSANEGATRGMDNGDCELSFVSAPGS
jgi:hypothetical protein